MRRTDVHVTRRTSREGRLTSNGIAGTRPICNGQPVTCAKSHELWEAASSRST
jgi:hypothetical protein